MPRCCSHFARSTPPRDIASAMKAPPGAMMTPVPVAVELFLSGWLLVFRGGILQKLCHGLEDFERKVLIRYGAPAKARAATSALIVKIAFDHAARLSLPGTQPVSN